MTRPAPRGTVKHVERPRTRPLLIGLLLLSLGVRGAWGLMQPAEPDERLGDQFEYLQLGRNLIHEGQLRFYDNRFEQWVYAYRTPGYPALIAACGGNVRAVRAVQSLFDTSVVLAVYILSRRFLAPYPSLAAAALVAVNPFLIYFSALILSETLFTALLMWGVCLLLISKRGWGAALLALSVLVRPSVIGLVLILAAAAAWSDGWRARIRSALLAGICVLVVLVPWAWRNAHHPAVQAWIWTTTNEGITTYDGFHDGATGASDQKPFVTEMRTLLSRMDEVDRDAFLGQKAHEWIRAHPGRTIQLMGSKIARTWSPVPLSNEYGGNRLYVLVGLLYGLPFDLLVLAGLWKGGLPKTAQVILLLPAIYFTAIHALSVGSLRYRIPVEPPMALIAGSGAAAVVAPLLYLRPPTPDAPSRRKSG